jgi:heme exporter protein B
MKIIVKHELKIQTRINNLLKYTFIFLLFASFSTTLINSQEDIRAFGIVFSVICIPLAFIGLSQGFIKYDIEDGTLEHNLSIIQPSRIILGKYIALCLCVSVSFLMVIPIIIILYDISNPQFIALSLSGLILIALSSALGLLISSIQGYFRTNTNFLSILIMPLIVPNIILSGMVIQSPQDMYFITIMIGIDMIIIPPSLYLSSYLIENIYNV